MSTANGPSPYSYWVIPGRFAAGEYPGAKDPVEAAPKLEALLKAGVNHFIDLTGLNVRGEPDNLTPYADIAREQADRLGLSVGWERHTIVDGSVPPSPWHMARILDAIDAALAEGKTIYLHCLGGVGRTGTALGCWLVRHGQTGDEALNRITDLFRASGLGSKHHHGSPETREQREYVRGWAEPPQGR